ncbi:ACP S-malonyltransferase [Niveispirillum irakense]|uniref:ACP S-malonyltransferase n=1 Tax=Niveispirillum irakense TaxID=34011 RepID=UPI0003F81406|nr:acyltransferase domain-containing protein [Niveispirillum irakense]
MGLGILCPGQGGQHACMLEIVAGIAAAENALDQATPLLGQHPRDLLAGDPARITRNAVAQPLLCATQAAIWAGLQPLLPRPQAVAGYSIGELSAYHVAGSLDISTLLELAGRRASLMDAAMAAAGALGAMLGVRGVSRQRLAQTGARIAIANGPDRFVIGGRVAEIDALREGLLTAGASLTDIAVDVASHTDLMLPAVAPFLAALQQVPMAAPAFPVMAGIDGSPVWRPDRGREVLAAQLTRTVEWAACLDGLLERGCTLLLELGPGDALSRIARERYPDLPVRSVAEFQSLPGVAAWVRRYLE